MGLILPEAMKLQRNLVFLGISKEVVTTDEMSAVIPQAMGAVLKIDPGISAFLGGTGLLITVSVTLDLVQRIEANLVMRNYGGFLGGGQRIKGSR